MKKNYLIILFVVVIALAASNIVLNTNNKRAPIKITSYASIAEMSLDDLIIKADLIVVGEIITIHPGRWNTPNGNLPENATLESVSKQHLLIFTDANFQVNQFLKGNTNNPILRIRTFGGQAGEDSMIISSEPSLSARKAYLLFLSWDTGSTADIDPGDLLVLGGLQGMYEIIDKKASSANGEWNIEELIAYIQNALQSSQ